MLWLCARTPSWDARCGWGRVVGVGGRGLSFLEVRPCVSMGCPCWCEPSVPPRVFHPCEHVAWPPEKVHNPIIRRPAAGAPEPLQGWSPERCWQLARDVLCALPQLLPVIQKHRAGRA